MSRIRRGAREARTVVFPRTVRDASEGAFRNGRLLAAVMNEGLERLGDCGDKYYSMNGVFQGTRMRHATVPATLRELGHNTFSDCGELRRVVFAEGSRLERIGDHCFVNTGITEIAFPETLRRMGRIQFYGCRDLGNIYMADGCGANLSDICMPDHTQVGPLPNVMVGGRRVWDLRMVRDVVIPEGAEAVGNSWFAGSCVESVELPGSVREVGPGAFCHCKGLKRLVFGGAASSSRLRVIRAGAFHGCSGLRRVDLPDGLEEIGRFAFRASGLRGVALPRSVRTVRQGAFY